MLGKLRYKLFWLIDRLQKNNIRRHYNEIKFLNEDYNSSSAQVVINTYKNNLLEHAINSTNFYKDYSECKFEDFPVVNKNIIRDNFSDFESIFYKRKQRFKVSTSGSTGTPFITYLNKNKKLRNSADTIYFANKSGFNIGDKLFYIRLWDTQHKKKFITSWILNIVSHNISDLRDVDIKELLDNITNDKSNKGLLAYASAFDTICQYLDKINSKPIDCNMKSIIGMSERLSEYAKLSMEKYFGVPVVSRYSASETGILAQQNINESNFNINLASYVVEILNLDRDETVKHGTLGRIVITDLFNYSVPLIRYDTGDLGTMILVENLPVFSKVEGRRMDMIYNTDRELISSHIVHEVCLFKGIKQYQLIQIDEKDYLFKLSTSNEFKQEDVLINKYKKHLGEDANITVEYIDYIPILSSGKRKKVINKYIPN
jgi:phenylacetate-CoA ligase